ncbi:YcnI family copper-binding membrane protein [Paenibacillus andongensis]|uniref:YcnI family copper-binding membrane protein n=1 Tax=Paenibacillus andongensis TaxID=2975482 RepID=UPI0021BAB835|nr:YcnI family protein [Paenibacillus andongensis]
MKKLYSILISTMLSMILLSGIASAHVSVLPSEAKQGSYEKFTVRVPNEKDIPTVKVEVKFPIDDVAISRFAQTPGWKYEAVKDASGKITSAIWTATGDGVLAGEFIEFETQGKVGDKATSISWKAYQTYKDGSVVEWTGAAGSDKPASVTKVVAGAGTDSHGQPLAGAASEKSSNNSSLTWALYIAGCALVVALLALFINFRKSSK